MKGATRGAGTLALAAVVGLALHTSSARSDDSVYRRNAVIGQHVTVLDATGSQSTPQIDPSAVNTDADTPAPRTRQTAIPFRSDSPERQAEPASSGGARPLITVTSSLAIVLGLFAAVTFLYRRTATASGGMLSGDAFTVLGKAPLGPRQNLTVVRIGPRILVLAIGPGSTTPLAELNDPDEVAQLTALCQSGGSRQAFQRTLHELGEEPPLGKGFVQPSAPPTRRGPASHQGLFASG